MIYDVAQKILETLQRSTIATRELSTSRQRFWAVYRSTAEEFDGEFLRRYRDDLDNSIIFVSSHFAPYRHGRSSADDVACRQVSSQPSAQHS